MSRKIHMTFLSSITFSTICKVGVEVERGRPPQERTGGIQMRVTPSEWESGQGRGCRNNAHTLHTARSGHDPLTAGGAGYWEAFQPLGRGPQGDG